ncbi:MAG TPA: hypothetical protein VGU72_01200 [Beijerinckiaceae bacterium]|jgi:hypothetical protein|nr:hypothetical protein [Beijerinckiaceae bacterium]
MDIIDFTSGGFVHRWTLLAGQPRCVEDAILSSYAGALSALRRNAAIRAALPPVAEYEAAQGLVGQGEPDNGEPRQVPEVDEEGQPVLVDASRPIMVDNPAWALLPRMVIVTDPETGEETEKSEPRWVAYDAAVALIADASPVVKAFALWRRPEPVEGEEGRLEWLAAGQLVVAAIDDAAETPLEADPRPVPQVVLLWRVKAVLANMGKLSAVDTLIRAQPMALQLYWSNGAELERTHPLLSALAVSPGFEDFTPVAIDEMFRETEALGI